MGVIGCNARRAMMGMVVGIGLVGATSAALVPLRTGTSRTTPALALVVAVVVSGLVGGRLGAVVTAVLAAAAFNLAFIPPYWTFEVDVVEDVVALVVFTVVALAVGTLVARLSAVQGERERLAEEATRLAVLEQVDQQRAALLRSVSHDLRTPLSTIRAVTSDLRDGAEYDASTRDELLDLVIDQAERLDRIVANLLSLSRIEAGAFQPQRQAVALDELVAEAVKRLDRALRQVTVQVDIPDTLPLADVDYSQLDQVVTNLLENAARYSPPGSKVRVEGEHRNGLLVLSVEDEGPGVPPADRLRVFDPFWHDARSTTSGVGLSICKAIVEAHGGTITVAEGERGARFELTVPARTGPSDT